jgi:acylphosphatase
MKRSVRIHVIGKVQGVLYRKFTKRYAEKFNLEGTVRNLDDGSIEILASGASDKLDDFIDILYKGSTKSEVENVIVEPLGEQRDFRGVFRVIGTR